MTALPLPDELGAFDPAAPLLPSGNLRRRLAVSRLAEAIATGAALLAVAVLAIVVYTVVQRGGGQISFAFLTQSPPAIPGDPGGGIAPAIVGTAVIVALATAIAMPLGILVALFMTEIAPRSRAARVVRLALDLMNGLPSIVIGVFVFGLLVVGRGQSALAGSVALAIIMLPLIARSSQEVLALVPSTLREAADALGVSRWRSVLGVILPSALGGILTGTLLAVARAAGETAPLILTTSVVARSVDVNPFGHALDSIPVSIWVLSQQSDLTSLERAWGAALVLLAFILITSTGARALLHRNRRRLTG